MTIYQINSVFAMGVKVIVVAHAVVHVMIHVKATVSNVAIVALISN